MSVQPLLNTSWTLHRLSPLQHPEFQTLLGNQVALKTYANRLREQLIGNSVTGAYIGTTPLAAAADEEALSKTGALKACTWEPIDIPDEDGQSSISGISIVLEYENAVYKAALLAGRDGQGSRGDNATTALPLLLTRLPNALRQTVTTFLSATFDVYCALLRLPPYFLCTGLERYLHNLTGGSSGPVMDPSSDPRFILEDVVKEMQLTLSFSQPIAPSLKSLNVNVPRESFSQFVLPSTNAPAASKTPFLTSLGTYLETHLAMKLDLDDLSGQKTLAHQYIRLSKVACSAFVLGTEGRLKLVANLAEDDDDEAALSQKNLRVLSACKELLQAIIDRAAAGEHATT
ncbi:hypothetical protein ASPZODRAFT_18600 [Penicilliopsis zonata CBS 506.65]|uniref:Uncharacterized protein n=1 Tax=Penicilliopsis zonata CBS 506.65 TaxID=1073090 RepID=A0A1L9SBB1_9EURO|nr:hypothetical protein ASPZODRAFT_18600 [Penicilliopsis zonata CBS 506.65]OJJ44407.1 hypothetical protein ASPZODRAFT_18600 [Penicilliopsis zonata CBS 506.65]